MKNKKNLGIIIGVIILVVIISVIYFKFIKKQSLDVNSEIVQELYSMVNYDSNNWDKFWMYDNNDIYDITSDKENIKMNLLSINLNNNELKKIECNSIPDNVYDYYSACSMQNEFNYAYDREYVEKVYKNIFGEDTSLNLDKDIYKDAYKCEKYIYIKELDKYVLYSYDGCGGMYPEYTYTSKILKAEKDFNQIKIYEEVEKKDTESEKFSIIYTFKKNSNNKYYFYSMEKVK